MTHAEWIRRGTWAAALLGATASGAAAQGFEADGGGRKSGPLFGVELFSDERELVLDKYKEGGLAAPSTPPPGYTSFDEEVLEHRTQFYARHGALRALVQYLNDGPVATRVGAWLGPVWAELGEHIFSGDFNGTAPPRARNSITSKTGFGGGVVGEVRGTIPGGPIFWSLGLDAMYAQVVLDNGLIFTGSGPGGFMDGEYNFGIATLQGRLGFTPRGAAVAPFVGVAGTYYYGDASLESVAGSTFYSADATLSERAYVRGLVGFDFGKGAEWSGRVLVGIGKPDADLIVHVAAFVRV